MVSKRSTGRPSARGPTPKEYQQFSVAHQNVLLERMEKNIAVIAEGHTFLREKLEQVDAKVDSLDAKVDSLQTDMVEVKGRLDRLEEMTLEILNRLKSLEARVAALEAKLNTHLETHAVSDDSAERLRQLEARVAHLEAHVT